MLLTLRPTGLSSPAYRHQLDYVVIEDGQKIGRMLRRSELMAAKEFNLNPFHRKRLLLGEQL